MTEPMFAIDELHTYYGDSHILQGVSLALGAGQAVGLLGRNGMGKTTLIRTLMGYVPARSGRLRADGRDCTGAPPERMARLGIGYVPEGRGIFPNLSVRENLVMSARPGLQGERHWTLERVLDTFPRLAERLEVLHIPRHLKPPATPTGAPAAPAAPASRPAAPAGPWP